MSGYPRRIEKLFLASKPALHAFIFSPGKSNLIGSIIYHLDPVKLLKINAISYKTNQVFYYNEWASLFEKSADGSNICGRISLRKKTIMVTVGICKNQSSILKFVVAHVFLNKKSRLILSKY
jgi:hypothetical protein